MPRVNRHDSWSHHHWVEPYRSAWKVAIAIGDAFRPGGPANLLAPRTVWNNERAFGRYSEFKRRTGRSDDGLLPDIDNLRAFDLELSATLAAYSRLALLTQLTGALRLMFPSADLGYLNKVAARKARIATPARSVEDKLIDPLGLIKVASIVMLEIVKEGRTGRRSAGLPAPVHPDQRFQAIPIRRSD